MRQPESISVCLAELLPRKREWDSKQGPDHSDYCLAHTYWSSTKLWDFIGVPFGVVSLAIRDVSKTFQKKLREGLRTLLPHEESKTRQGELFTD